MSIKKQQLSFAGLVLAAILTPQSLWSQEVTGSIVGTVTDQTHSAVAQAKVTVQDLVRQVVSTTVTNEVGFYSLPRLAVGTYSVRVDKTGFASAEIPKITLVLDQIAHLDFALSLGNVAETLNVTATTPILQTDSTQLNTVINERTNTQLPLATRNYVQLTLLSAGAITPNPAGFKTPQTTYNGDRAYINGNREQENNYLLDGLDNNQQSDNLVAYTPSVDAIEEFSQITQNAPAEFGNFMGGIVSVSTKSGTNQFHGSAFEFFRNDQLNANEWQNNFAGAARPKLRWNEFGAALGGAIKKNRLFFFADYQGSRYDQPATTTAVTVLTTAERQGNFSQLLTLGSKSTQLYNPFSVDANGHRAPFSGNIIPTNLINPAAAKILDSDLYPTPANENLTNNQFNTAHSQTNGDQGDVRVDWNYSDTDRIFGRYSQSSIDNPTINGLPLTFNTFGNYPIHNGVLGYTKTITPALVNDFRAGVNYNVSNLGTAPTQLGNVPQQFGIPGVPTNILPDLTFTGGLANDLGTSENVKLFADTLIQYGDTLNLTWRKHVISIGFQGQRIRLDTFYAGGNGVAGTFAFNGQFTTSGPAIKFGSGQGQPEADFLLGLPSSIAVGAPGTTLGQRTNTFAAFVQDAWRITNGLTLTLGLRYDLFTPWVEVNNRQVNFAPFTGDIEIAGQSTYYNNNRALYNQYNGIFNYQPRLGIAWTPNSRTVVRASYTLSSYMEGTGTNLRLIVNPPYFPQESANYANLSLPTTTLDQGYLPFGSPSNPYTGANLRVWDPNVRPAVSNQWNATIQRQFGDSTTLQASYVGQKNDHLMVAQPYFQKQLNADGSISPSPYLAGNPLLSSISNISGTESNGNQFYNALQVTIQRRLENGLEFQAAYTWSKCMTDSTGFYGEGNQAVNQSAYVQNLYNRQADWGPCYYDATHNFVGYWTWDVPFGRHRQFGKNLNKIANVVLGDWQVNGILSLHTGFPLTISGSDNSGTSARSARASCIAPATVYGLQDSPLGGYQWFDPSTFVPAAQRTFGTCGVGTVRGPGLHTADIGLSKSFPITEGQKIEFRTEFINITNTPILNAPKAALGSTLGLLQSSQGARNIQLALKYSF